MKPIFTFPPPRRRTEQGFHLRTRKAVRTTGTTSVEARSELLNHVSEIKMIPQSGDGKPHYVAEGSWHLLGIESDSSEGAFTQIRMVAGAGFEPATFGL